LLSDNRDDRDVVLITLGILHKLANGADQSKVALKKTKILNVLPTLRALYSLDQAVNEVTTGILTDIHKPGHNAVENSDQSDDSESSDDLDLRNLQFSLQSNPIDYDEDDEEEVEKKHDSDERAKIYAFQRQVKLDLEKSNQELWKETENTKNLEQQLRELQAASKKPKPSKHELLELKQQNKSLQEEIQEINSAITELCMKTTDAKNKTNKLTKQKTSTLAELKEESQGRENQIQDSLRVIQKQDECLVQQEKELAELKKIDHQVEEAAEILKDAQRMTFHWMTLALKLDFSSKNKKGGQNVNFDKQALYNQLISNGVPHEQWPAEILKALRNSNRS